MVLGSNGAIAEQGTYDVLRSQGGYIASLLKTQHTDKDTNSIAIDGRTRKVSRSPAEPTLQDKARKTGDFAVYRYWFKSISIPSTIAFIGTAAFYSFFRSFSQYWLKWWAEDSGHAGKYITIYALLSLLALVFEAFSITWVLIYIGPNSGERLHNILLQTVMKAPQIFFSQTDTGITINRFSQDMNLIDRILPASALNVVIRSFRILAQGVLLFSAEKYMTGSIPLCLLVLFVIQKVYLQTSRQLRLLDLESKSPVYTQFLETVRTDPLRSRNRT